jgi:hypothetical protein
MVIKRQEPNIEKDQRNLLVVTGHSVRLA